MGLGKGILPERERRERERGISLNPVAAIRAAKTPFEHPPSPPQPEKFQDFNFNYLKSKQKKLKIKILLLQRNLIKQESFVSELCIWDPKNIFHSFYTNMEKLPGFSPNMENLSWL